MTGKKNQRRIERILLAEGKRFYVRNIKEDYHTNLGVVSKKELKKKSGKVMTGQDIELSIFMPGFVDLYSKLKRAPQIIPRKDIGIIIIETGVNKSSTVVDAGAGSGALCIALANISKKVVSYEVREDFANIAKENVRMLGLRNLTIKHKDIMLGIEEKDVDIITLDLPNPWDAVSNSEKSLKIGGFIVSYSPTIPQVMDFVSAVRKNKSFSYIKTIEVSEREWEIEDRKVRPKSQQIGHSGFISFARRV